MNIRLFTFILFASFLLSCGNREKTEDKINQDTPLTTAKITFIELGSVNCIPCRQMQPVMRSIEEKYGDVVKVVFHDVWKDRSQAQKYGIQLIPTQVFLDENGKEFFRHEGFFAEEEIIKLFETKGVIPVKD